MSRAKYVSDNLSSLGPKIKDLRKGKGWDQAQLATQSGIAAASISRIENGKLFPRLPTLEAIAQALGVPLSTFAMHPDSTTAAHRDPSGLEPLTSEEQEAIRMIREIRDSENAEAIDILWASLRGALSIARAGGGGTYAKQAHRRRTHPGG